MIRVFATYLADRFRPGIFVPATALHVVLVLWATDATPTAARLASATGLAALLLLQFRLWDDLEDRAHDRVTHPNRVLVRVSPTPFVWALTAIGFGNLLAVASAPSGAAWVGLLLLDGGFVAAYRLRARLSDHVWTFGVLLLKYPAFVLLIAAAFGTPRPGPLALAMCVMYVAASGFEIYHNRHRTIGAMP